MNIDAVTVEVSKLSLGPDDVLVLRVPDDWTQAMAADLTKAVQHSVLKDLRVVVLLLAVELAVVNQADLPE